MTVRFVEELLAESPVFGDLEPRHRATVAGCAVTAHAGAGELLFREDEPADDFVVIRSGRIALELHAPGRTPLLVETLEAGAVVGWSWLFEPYRWQFDIRAVEDCRLLRFDAACLRGKAGADHELGYQLMRHFAAAIVDRLQHTRVRLLDLYGSGDAG